MIRICIVAALALALSGCAESNPQAEQAAFDATKPWLALMDAGDFDVCWETAAPSFRELINQEDWVALAHEYRDPLGAFKSRNLSTTSYFTDMWGAPAGEYAVVVYDSRWEAGAIYESLTMQRQPDGAWLLVGYAVQQQ